MPPAKPEDLTGLWNDRLAAYGARHVEMDKLIGIYEGFLPSEFNDYFDKEMHVHVVNMIRLAWDDLTAMTGKVFPIYVRPDNNKAAAKKRAERQELIGYGYNQAGRRVGGISMGLLMKVLSWWLIGCGNAVLMTLPDYDYKTPFFTFRDPRTHYPPVGWSPYSQASPEDTLFAYAITLGEVKRRFPNANTSALTRRSIGMRGRTNSRRADDSDNVWIGEYYHADSWMFSTLNEDQNVLLERSDTGDKGHPGIMPVSAFGLYSALHSKGRSMFSDQVSIQAAMARMFSQKLDFFDRTLYPLIFHTPLSGDTIKMGPLAANEYNMSATIGGQPKVDTVAPAHQVDADQTMAFVLGLSRMLNRNPEQFQGQGDADSAKALEQLESGVRTTIRDGIWPGMIEVFPTAYANAAKLDTELWGNVKKTARGDRKNRPFFVDYTPGVHLKGREHDFDVEAGLGLAGYQGKLEMMQLRGAGMVSLETALEQGEWVRDPDEERRRIQGNQIEDLEFATLAAQAQAGALLPGALAEVKMRVAGGDDLYEVISELEAAGRLLAPPPALPGAPPGAPPGASLEEAPPIPSMAALGR